MSVGTAVPTIIVGTIVPTKIDGTKICLAAVPITFVETGVPTNVVRTTVHITSLKIGQFNAKGLSTYHCHVQRLE